VDLRKLGEFGLIEAIRRRAGRAPREWRIAIGDDAAVLTPRRGEELVFTTDAVVEDVHFRWRTSDPRSVGHKALAVNLSDVGAMGARPIGFLLTLGLPARVTGAQLDGFFAGLLALARTSHCPLVGGDITRAREFVASITAIGGVARGRALRRDAARPGDRVFVTGALGAAAAGLRLAAGPGARTPAERALVRRQNAPRPPWRAGERLVRLGVGRAAIDVSDGLAQDLGHVLRASGVGARVELERVPVARGATPEEALAGGEDYELLFTATPGAPSAAVLARRLGCRVSEIGVITARPGLVIERSGRPVQLGARGFQHFKASPKGSEK
jgi:thiamine-monophosphate kinase